jgi:hypothetical protein
MTSEGLSAYMASLQEKRRQLEERRRKAQTRQQVRERTLPWISPNRQATLLLATLCWFSCHLVQHVQILPQIAGIQSHGVAHTLDFRGVSFQLIEVSS